MKLLNKVKIYLTTGLIAPMVSQCTVEANKSKIEKPKPATESLAYLAYKERNKISTIDGQKFDLPILFGDEWAI